MDKTRLILSILLMVFGAAELAAALFGVKLPGFASVLMGLFLTGWGVKTLLDLRRENRKKKKCK